MKARILIFYASIGTGHLTAARSIQSALLEQSAEIDARLVDVFGHAPRRSQLLDRLSGWLNLALPWLYTWSWQTGGLMPIFHLGARMPWIRRQVRHEIETFRPALIACTHALPCAVTAGLSGLRGQIPLAAVATDFDVHPYWPAQQLDAFVTAGEAGRQTLLRRGVVPGCIHPFGIPIRASLVPHIPERPAGDFSVLVVAGGGQIGPYLPIQATVTGLLRRLATDALPGTRWTFVYGANRRLLEQARRLVGEREDIELHGYVDDLPARMAAADLLLAKPGGLTLAEACAQGTPALLLTRGAGQEAANARVLQSAKAARLAPSPAEILAQVRALQSNPGELHAMAKAAAALGRPDAARDTARLLARLAGQDRL